jgi:ubiquinone/menaquinone biosynthesis C-methylase UbiE
MLSPEFWRRYFKIYDVLNSLPTYRQLLAAVCEELGAREKELILDVGSGTGNLSLVMRGTGCEVVALDYCYQALERHRAKDKNCCLVLADLTKSLPFRDNCFDKIGSNNTLYTLSIDNQLHALKELYRILKPSGKIVLANSRKGWKPMKIYLKGVADNIRAEGLWITARKVVAMMIPTIKMFYYNRKLQKESQYHYFEPEEQRTLLEAIGFRLVSHTKLIYAEQAVLNSAYK